MPKYRRKPEEIEAIIVENGYRNLKEIIEFVGKENVPPIERRPDYKLRIKTLAGCIIVYPGDRIVKEYNDFVVFKEGCFEEIYELVRNKKVSSEEKGLIDILKEFQKELDNLIKQITS